MTLLITRGRSRLDVLVEAQDVCGIVFFLDLSKASIIWAVGRADKSLARFAELVAVGSLRKGLQLVAQGPDPLHRACLLCWTSPTTHEVHFAARLPQRKRSVLQTHARDGAVNRNNEHPGVGMAIVGRSGNRLHCEWVELQKNQVGLEMRDGRVRINGRLGFQVGGNANLVLLWFQRSQRP